MSDDVINEMCANFTATLGVSIRTRVIPLRVGDRIRLKRNETSDAEKWQVHFVAGFRFKEYVYRDDSAPLRRIIGNLNLFSA